MQNECMHTIIIIINVRVLFVLACVLGRKIFKKYILNQINGYTVVFSFINFVIYTTPLKLVIDFLEGMVYRII